MMDITECSDVDVKNFEIMTNKINRLTDDIRTRYFQYRAILNKTTYYVSKTEWELFEISFNSKFLPWRCFRGEYDDIKIKIRPTPQTRVWDCPVG